MKIKVRKLPEPKLRFGNGELSCDPKDGLARGGPFGKSSRKEAINIGLVTTRELASEARTFFSRFNEVLLPSEKNSLRFKVYPGSKDAFGVRFELSERHVRLVDSLMQQSNLTNTDNAKFESLLELYSTAIGAMLDETPPDVVIVVISQELADLRIQNQKLSFSEQKYLHSRAEDEDSGQLGIFDDLPEEELVSESDIIPQPDDLLFRNFYRALKARCMSLPNAVPIQVIRSATLVSNETQQSMATKMWNLGTGLYYKALGMPWLPSKSSDDTCFVGISFHNLKRRNGDVVYASVAQAIAADTEPFALQGAVIPRDQVRHRSPFLDRNQSKTMAADLLKRYLSKCEIPPKRVVFHKTSEFQPEEIAGIKEALKSLVPQVDYVWLRPSGIRFLRMGGFEPERGALFELEGQRWFLFTTGYVDGWQEYPGPHIPSPIEVGGEFQSDISVICNEILSLSKLNWNSADGIGKYPVTLSFSRRVGAVLTEYPDDASINPLYRYYM